MKIKNPFSRRDAGTQRKEIFFLSSLSTSASPREILFLFCFLFIPVQMVFSQGIIIDPSDTVGFNPTPVILDSTRTSGVPLINIKKPSAGGVSHNNFTEYNVDVIGLILNNSTTGGTSGLDGGAVVANPNFAGTAASVILNQVTGTNPSNLLGPTEIFGTKAKLILANPNGITVNGASFINTGRLTLTTAIPTVTGSDIAFNVGNTSGITVGVSGFTGGGDVVDLLSRTVTLNGPVSNATTLDIRAGSQNYDYVTSVSSSTGGAAPGGTTYSIDAAALGAANAGQIKLIATDVGVGVRTASTMSATAGNFTISANGDIVIGGQTTASSSLNVTSANGSITSTAKTSAAAASAISAKNNVTLSDIQSTAKVDVSSTSGALDLTSLGDFIAGEVKSSGDTKITANSGTLTHQGAASTVGGKLTIASQNFTSSSGSKIDTTGKTSITATQAVQVDGKIYGKDEIKIKGNSITASSSSAFDASTVATATLNLDSTTTLSLAGSSYSKGGTDLKSGSSTSHTGTLLSDGALTSTSVGFSNTGTIEVASASITQTTSSTLNNSGGTIKSTTGGITVTFDTINNASGFLNAKTTLNLTANSGGFNNAGGLIQSYDNMTLSSTNGGLSNGRGYILSFGDLTINLPNGEVDNTVGSIQASGNTTITATSLTNKRTAKSRTATNERSYYEQETSGEATISSDGNLTIDLTGALLNEASTIAAGNDLTITASSATNDSHFLETETWHQTRRRVGSLWWRRTITEWSYGGKSSTETPSYIYAGNNLTITIPGGFNNTGTIQANDFILNSGTINNGLQGRRTKAPAPTVPKNILTVSVSASLPDPANPLFHISSDPTTPYVIASVITPPSGFYTRDDIVALLGIAGQVNAKFFSDPLLEAKLIRQLVQLNTGKSFIYDDTKTDREQRQKLIDNMVTYLQTHPEITFGSIMSKEFVATLPAPMLWYELRTDAKTGITAYMPTLYLPNASLLDLKRFGGGQIVANNATLTAAGAMKNTGYVMVDQNLSITASEFINEKRTVTDYASYTQKGGMFGTDKTKTREFQVADFGGEIQAGDVTINTTGDITNRGGVIVADNDINLTSTQGSVKNEAIKSQFLVSWDRGNLGALFGKKSSDLGTTFVSGQILAGDEINIDAAQNFENIASKVSAFGDINVIAEQNINQDLQTATYRTFDGGNFNINYDVSKIWFNPLGLGSSSASRTVVVTQRAETTSQTGSVNFTARNGDITSRGSTIGAGVDVNLEATQGNVLLDALTTYGKETSNQVQDTGVGKREINKAWNTATTELPVVTAGRDINITAGKNVTGNGVIASAGRDINVTAGNDINITSVKEYLHLDEHGQSLELSFVGSEIVKALYLGTDVGQAAIDSVSIAKQIQTLSKSRSAMDWMANGTQTASTAWDSAAGASAAYNNPNATASSKGLDAGQGGAYASAAVGGSVTQININYDRWVSLQSWTQSHLGEISAGNDINMTANRDINLKGGTQVVAQNNITLDAGRDITVEANKDVTESSYRSWGFTVGVDVQSLGVTVGGRQSWADSEGNTYTYGNVAAGNNLTVRSGNDLTLKGGTMSGDTVDIDVGGNLKIESLQNMYKSDSGNWSASVTVGFAGGGGSLSVGMASQDRLWADNMSGIEGKNGTNIRVEKNTDLVGGYINDKSGNLTLDTGSLTWSDLKNHDKSESFSVSVSGSYSGGGNSSGGAGATGATSAAGSAGGSGEGSTSGSLAFSYSNKDKEGLTKSTIGQGTIIVRDKPDQDLGGLNRDLTNAQTITKDDKTEIKVFMPIKGSEQWEKEGKSISTALTDIAQKINADQPQIAKAIRASAEDLKLQEAKTPEEQAKALKQISSNRADRLADFVQDMGEDAWNGLSSSKKQEVILAVLNGIVPSFQDGKITYYKIFGNQLAELNGLQISVTQDFNKTKVSDYSFFDSLDQSGLNTWSTKQVGLLVEHDFKITERDGLVNQIIGILSDPSKLGMQAGNPTENTLKLADLQGRLGEINNQINVLRNSVTLQGIVETAQKLPVVQRQEYVKQIYGDPAFWSADLMNAMSPIDAVSAYDTRQYERASYLSEVAWILGPEAAIGLAGKAGAALSRIEGAALRSIDDSIPSFRGFSVNSPSLTSAEFQNLKFELTLDPNRLGTSVTMDGYRIYNPEFPALSSNPILPYRYTDPIEGFKRNGDVYLADTPYTSYLEVRQNTSGKNMIGVNLNADKILDLTNQNTLSELGLNKIQLTQKGEGSYLLPQKISKYAYDNGFNGILFPSAQNEGAANLMLYGGRFNPATQIQTISDIPADQLFRLELTPKPSVPVQ